MRRSPAVWFTSYGLSLLGKGIAAAVLPLLVLDRTGDVLAAGLLATVTTAAAAATGLVSGLVVDRIDRRVVSVVSDVLAALSIAALPLVDAVGSNGFVLGATLVSAVLVAVVSSLQTTLMPAYFVAADLPALTGLTLSAFAAGSIAGSALYAALVGRVRRRTWFVVGMTGFGIGFALVGRLASPWLVLAAAALVGVTNAPVSAVRGVLTIEATPDAMRGRVLGAQNTILLAAPAATSAPIAAVAAAAGLPVAGAALAALAGVTALVALLAPTFRSLDAAPGADEPGTPRVAVGAP